MIRKVKTLLAECGVSVYRITEKITDTAELYFIKKALDMPRKKLLNEIFVTIFRDTEKDGKKLRASTDIVLSPVMSDEEMKKAISDAYFAAQFACNPYFELPTPEVCEHIPAQGDIAALSAEDTAKTLANAIFAVDVSQDAFLNSVEIFVKKTSTHMVSSNGLDISFDTCSAKGEFVMQCITPKDVEQYRSFEFDTLNTELLQQRVKDAIEDVRARARSVRPPKAGSYTIVLKGEHIRTIFDYYTNRSAAAMIYPGYSDWHVGTDVQGENVNGEKLDLRLIPSVPYSGEGIRMIERSLIMDGRLELIHGGAQFCYYLNAPATGEYRKISCGNGTIPYADMLGENVLEPVSFSDFQMDVFDGHFKGEIRLARLHHADGSVEELSGGSINGSITKAQNDLAFSNERYADSTYEGPLAIMIKDVAVAGE